MVIVIGFPRAGLWKTRFNSDSYNYGPNFPITPHPMSKPVRKEPMGCPARVKSASAHTRW